MVLSFSFPWLITINSNLKNKIVQPNDVESSKIMWIIKEYCITLRSETKVKKIREEILEWKLFRAEISWKKCFMH